MFFNKLSQVKERFNNGDIIVIEAMRTFATFAEKGKKVLEASQISTDKKMEQLAELMNENFNLR